MTPLYTAKVTAHGGREGTIHADEPKLDLKLAPPKALGGPGGEATNPEQLFAAGYAACFESAMRHVARAQKIAITDAHVTAQVTIGKTETGGFGLSVELHGKIEGKTHDEAHALMEAAHQVCPYSVATRGNIDVKLVVD